MFYLVRWAESQRNIWQVSLLLLWAVFLTDFTGPVSPVTVTRIEHQGSQTLENVIGYWCRKKLSLAPAFGSLALESTQIPHLNSCILRCDGWNAGLEESPQLCFLNSYNVWTFPKIPSFKTVMFPCYLHSKLPSLLFMILMFGLNFCSPLFLSINFMF